MICSYSEWYTKTGESYPSQEMSSTLMSCLIPSIRSNPRKSRLRK